MTHNIRETIERERYAEEMASSAEDAALDAELSAIKISAFNSSPASPEEVGLISALRVAAAADIDAMKVRQ